MHGEVDTGLLDLQPWLYLSLPLAVVWAARDAREGLLPVMLVAASVCAYLSFNDFWPFNVLRFSLIHYIVWALPILAAAGIAGGLLLVRGRQWKSATMTVIFALVLACYRLVPASVEPDLVDIQPAESGTTKYAISFPTERDVDAIDLLGASSGDPIGLTIRQIRLAVDDEKLELYSGYRLIELHGGIRVIFNKNVSTARIEFDLKDDIANHPKSPPLVRPVRFRGTFVAF